MGTPSNAGAGDGNSDDAPVILPTLSLLGAGNEKGREPVEGTGTVESTSPRIGSTDVPAMHFRHVTFAR